jgi:hypothetical protein
MSCGAVRLNLDLAAPQPIHSLAAKPFLFFQTELTGLKWKRLTTAESFSYGSNSLDQDPVLRAYSHCISAGVLCTWNRRKRVDPPTAGQQGIENIPLRLDTPKELWIFWYSPEEPEILGRLEGLIGE